MMELAQYPEDWPQDTENQVFNTSNLNADNDAMIQPWINRNKIMSTTLTIRKEGPSKQLERWHSQRKKTIDERIEEMYHKYNRQGNSNTHIGQNVNKREVYREMLKSFEKGHEFKQIGSKKQCSMQEMGNESITLTLFNQNNNTNISAYECQEARISPKKKFGDEKCVSKFQRMMKIRDKVRKKNIAAVSKLKEKYLNQYNPIGSYTQRQPQTDSKHADRQKARIKIRIRSQSKSKNLIQLKPSPPKNDFKIVGIYSNALDYAIKRGLSNYSSNSMRTSKYATLQMTKTYLPSRH